MPARTNDRRAAGCANAPAEFGGVECDALGHTRHRHDLVEPAELDGRELVVGFVGDGEASEQSGESEGRRLLSNPLVTGPDRFRSSSHVSHPGVDLDVHGTLRSAGREWPQRPHR